MWEQTLVFPSRRNRLTNCLHLFYVALFVFVLPFVCWDADDSPQHPHARPQLVFMLSVLGPQAAGAGINVDPMLVDNADSLAVTGLVLLGLSTDIWLPQIPHFAFIATLFPLVFAVPYFALELPPPR
jgi:hypothetical protein